MLGFGWCGAKLPSLQTNIYIVLINAAEIGQEGFFFAVFAGQLLLFFCLKHLQSGWRGQEWIRVWFCYLGLCHPRDYTPAVFLGAVMWNRDELNSSPPLMIPISRGKVKCSNYHPQPGRGEGEGNQRKKRKKPTRQNSSLISHSLSCSKPFRNL